MHLSLTCRRLTDFLRVLYTPKFSADVFHIDNKYWLVQGLNPYPFSSLIGYICDLQRLIRFSCVCSTPQTFQRIISLFTLTMYKSWAKVQSPIHFCSSSVTFVATRRLTSFSCVGSTSGSFQWIHSILTTNNNGWTKDSGLYSRLFYRCVFNSHCSLVIFMSIRGAIYMFTPTVVASRFSNLLDVLYTPNRLMDFSSIDELWLD